jgi:pyruvate dehydrogenase E2 component (dihydrolipoamide acetyltransferase)
MAHKVTIPRLGWSMEEGTFAGWKRRDGEFIRAGEPLFELEGEKAVQEIEAVDSGVLRLAPDAPAAGSVVAVGRVIGFLLEDNETAPNAPPAAASNAEPTERKPGSPTTPSTANAAAPVASPSVRRLARELGVPLAAAAPAAGADRITARDVRAVAESRGAESRGAVARGAAPRSGRVRLHATPRARRLARQAGVELSTVIGSGRHHRIRERDVRASLVSSVDMRAAAPVAADSVGVGEPLSSVRRTIAGNLRRSRDESVSVTLHARADAGNLVSLRDQFRAGRGGSTAEIRQVPSYTDLLVKLAAAVLRRHPRFAQRWHHGTLVAPQSWDIGVAVDTEQGLVVPVVRDVPALRISELAARVKDLAERARERRLRAEEMDGGVFTVSTLGSLGVETFTPIIRWPEVAILGVGEIRREPCVVADDRIEPRWTIRLSLSFDHCANDGAPAARFLKDLCLAIENPAAWLLE